MASDAELEATTTTTTTAPVAATTHHHLGLAVATVEGNLYEFSVEIDLLKFRGRKSIEEEEEEEEDDEDSDDEDEDEEEEDRSNGVTVVLERELFVGGRD